MLLKCLDVDPRKRIGHREMMLYLFNKEEINHLTESKSHSENASTLSKVKISIPTTITETEDLKN